jgi:lysine decarboxylase
VRGTGATGYELAQALRRGYDLHVELATSATLVMVLGVAEPSEPLARLPRELAAVAEELARPGEVASAPHPGMEIAPQVALPPRDAFLGDSERVPVERAEGRISCESVAGYPPGIPALLPGERITTEVIEYLIGLRALGARLHGASDPEFRSIYVLRPAADDATFAGLGC